MYSPARPFIEPEHNDPYAEEEFCFVDESEIDDLSDPFLILAQREERAGVPLIHLNVDHHD